MDLLRKSIALSTHAFFFREGDAFTLPGPGGVCAVDAKPDADDEGWIELGTIEKGDDKIVDESTVTIWTPSPGHLTRKDIITLKQAMDHSFTTNDMTPLAVESFYRTSQKLDEASAQFNALSAVPRKGWVKFQRYDQDDRFVLVGDIWCRLTVTGGMNTGGSDLCMPEFLAQQLYSALQTFG